MHIATVGPLCCLWGAHWQEVHVVTFQLPSDKGQSAIQCLGVSPARACIQTLFPCVGLGFPF